MLFAAATEATVRARLRAPADSLASVLTVVVAFCASFVAACVVSLGLVRAQRLPRERFASAPLAVACGAVVVLMALIGAFGIVGWDSAATGAGCGLGILAGRSLGLSRAQSPG